MPTEEMASTSEANITRSKNLPWYQSNIGSSLTPAGRELLEQYSGIAPAEVEKHILQTRDSAWEIFPWPCIGEFWFATLGLSLHPYYGQLLYQLTNANSSDTETATINHTKPLKLLDLGTCLGQDLRKLLYDGAPLISLYGSDILPEYEKAGQNFFCDGDKFTHDHFIAADVLDSSPGNGLVKTEGTWDIIAITMFLHIWDLETQIQACKRILKLVKQEKGSLIIGSQTGNEQAHALLLKPPFGERSVYRHNLESFKAMWLGVADETGVCLEVHVDYAKQEGTNKLVGELAGEEGKQKFFSGPQDRRLVFTIEVV